MAYTCQWPCVSDAVPSAPAMVQAKEPLQSVSSAQKSSATALAGPSSFEDRPYPSPCIKGDALSIKICQEEYRKGIEDCKHALRARLTLLKGDKPYSARDLSIKIGKLWKTTAGWKMVPLGKGFYDFLFDSEADYRKIWALGTINLKPGLLRFSRWTTDFKFQTQKQTHASIWIRLVALPQEYWRERTLKEIASAVGTPIEIDGPTRNRIFGHYARILVDMDLSKRIYEEILVEREGFAFKVEVQYERLPLFCHHCFSIGHNVSTCRWLHPPPPKDKNDRGKQVVGAKAAPHKKAVGASANGTIQAWVPLPVVSIVTSFPVVSAATTSSAPLSLALPVSIPQTAPVDSITVATSQFDRSNNFSIPLHNVFDVITPTEMPLHMSVIEPVSHEAHDDVQPVEVRTLIQKPREELENPLVTADTESLLDSVKHTHMNPRELVESPKESNVRVTHSSPPGREDLRPNGVE